MAKAPKSEAPPKTAKKTEPKNKGGRPLAEFDLPNGWAQKILKIYEQGGSDYEVKLQIYKWRKSFSNDLWTRWLRDVEEFSETIKMGQMLAEGWWHKNGRTNLKNKDFSWTGWYMNMKNRYGWKDKSEIDAKVKVVEAELSDRQAEQLLAARAKRNAS